jgi:putative FmdB family regulatory protein
MPLYTYRCSNCGVQFEQQQKYSDASLIRCPECGKKTLQKVYSPVGVVFKGSGFYATDHRSPSGVTNGSSDEKSKADTGATKKTEEKKPIKDKNKPAETSGKEKE